MRIVVTPTSGPSRALGPFMTAGVPGGLLASPDGGHLLVLPYDDGNGGGVPVVVPVAGGPAMPLRLPAGTELARPFSQATWSPDGDEIVVGDVIRTSPEPDDGGAPAGEDHTPLSGAALRCPVATLVCTALPGPAGSAVGFPGGVLVSSSPYSVLPVDYLLTGIGDEPHPDWATPSSAWGRLLLGVHRDVRESVTHAEAGGSRVVGRFAGRAADGVPCTLGLTGGASGALALRCTITTQLRTRDRRVRLTARVSGPRLLTVSADGTGRTGPVPRVRVARRDLRGSDGAALHGPQWLRVVPALGRPEGGWIGFGVRDLTDVHRHEALATMTADGRARVVRIGGRAATAATLVESVSRLRPLESASRLDLVGYERGTRSAILTVRWVAQRRGRPGSNRTTTLRVPLEGGGRPRVVTAGADAAW